MKILVTLGNTLLVKALCELLAREPGGYQAIPLTGARDVEKYRPDFIIADSHSIKRAVQYPGNGAKIVLLDYGLGENEIASLLLSYNLDGILSAKTDLDLFKKALKSIIQGQIWVDNHKIKALVNHADRVMGAGQDESLSKKERDIVLLISQGLTNREIASIVCISEKTVKTHISRIFRKMNVSRRSQLVPLAMKLKFSEVV